MACPFDTGSPESRKCRNGFWNESVKLRKGRADYLQCRSYEGWRQTEVSMAIALALQY
jgi:hypothetical protein